MLRNKLTPIPIPMPMIIREGVRQINSPYEVLRLSNFLREKSVGEEVTFVINRNINFTDICVNNCKFCSFSNKRKYELSLEQIQEKVIQALELGSTEVCIQGGLLPDADLDYYASIVEAVRDVSKGIHIHAFSPMEILHASKNSGTAVDDVLKELKRAGLNSMPGTAAEILDDEIRKKICPNKLNTERWTSVIESAHNLGIPTTATMMYGHIETWEHRIKHLMIIKDIQRRTGGFTEFIPLPFLSKNNELGFEIPENKKTPLEDLLVIALARIILYPELANIQASWVKLGAERVIDALLVGANDIGGTLFEENISKAAGSTSGEYMSVAQLKEIISCAGRVPRQRDTLYNKI